MTFFFPTPMTTGDQLNTEVKGVAPGAKVRLLLSGLGESALPAGSIASDAAALVAAIQLRIGDREIDASSIEYVGLATYGSSADALGLTPYNIGVYEIRVTLPEDLPVGDSAIQVVTQDVVTPAGGVLRVEGAVSSDARVKAESRRSALPEIRHRDR